MTLGALDTGIGPSKRADLDLGSLSPALKTGRPLQVSSLLLLPQPRHWCGRGRITFTRWTHGNAVVVLNPEWRVSLFIFILENLWTPFCEVLPVNLGGIISPTLKTVSETDLGKSFHILLK